MKHHIAVYGKWLLLVLFLVAAGCFYSRSSGTPEVLVSGAGEASQETVLRQEDVFADTAGAETSAREEQAEEDAAAAKTEPVYLYVHVCGEVVNPGVYKLLEGSRVYEAVELAGGFTEQAARAYVNLAVQVSDGMKVEIPDQNQAGALAASSGSMLSPDVSAQASGKVNLNRADRASLMTLKGIGEVRADAIIAYREEHGAFSCIEDIMLVPGIKDAAFQKIKDDIEV